MKMSQTKTIAETALLERLKKGDSQAVKIWFDEYHPRLLRFILSRVDLPKDAEEIAQETFINSLKQLTFFRGQASLLTWMQSITRHEVADYYRKRYAKRAIRALPLSDLLPLSRVSDSHEVAEQVKEVFKNLGVHHAELLMLKYIDNKKVEEIAAEFGKSVRSIESELFRARQAFKEAYQELIQV